MGNKFKKREISHDFFICKNKKKIIIIITLTKHVVFNHIINIYSIQEKVKFNVSRLQTLKDRLKL